MKSVLNNKIYLSITFHLQLSSCIHLVS